MNITFRPFSADEFADYKEWSIKDYADNLVKSSTNSKETALKASTDGFNGILPQGIDTPNNFFNVVVNELNEDVGLIWYLKEKSDQVFICDFFIYEKYRRKGYGKETLLMLEQTVKPMGIKEITLHAFDFNTPAISLYKSLGYEVYKHNEPQSNFMKKQI